MPSEELRNLKGLKTLTKRIMHQKDLLTWETDHVLKTTRKLTLNFALDDQNIYDINQQNHYGMCTNFDILRR